MLVNNKQYRTICLCSENNRVVEVIDQRFLPHRFVIEKLKSVNDIITAIKEMHVRGAGLIGVTAGYGMYLAALEAASRKDFNLHMLESSRKLKSSRPTAVNLEMAVKRQLEAIHSMHTVSEKITIAKKTAAALADEDADASRNIGLHGVGLIEKISRKKKGGVVNILTHCNAGWLAFVEHGTATAPIYEAFSRKIKIHVWVDETRPRNQGANLTAWELSNMGVPHTVITDNTGGHLMQHGFVDLVITGADRVTRTGDTANKIGTYLKALAANDNGIPFYIALPSTSIDWKIRNGLKEINIEQRNPDEVRFVEGLCDGKIRKVLVTPAKSKAVNYAFDVTPARLITGFITERGICKANEKALVKMFPECK